MIITINGYKRCKAQLEAKEKELTDLRSYNDFLMNKIREVFTELQEKNISRIEHDCRFSFLMYCAEHQWDKLEEEIKIIREVSNLRFKIACFERGMQIAVKLREKHSNRMKK